MKIIKDLFPLIRPRKVQYNMYSMDDSALLDVSSDDKTTIRETSQRDLPATFSRNLIDTIILSHQKPGSETVNPTKNIYNDNIEAT